MLAGAIAAPSHAQSLPLREGPILEAPKPAEPRRAATAPPSPSAVVQVYLNGCVLNEGQSGSVMDWALTNGFEPLDPMITGAEDLLGGTTGTVLAMPGSDGRVLLAAGADRRCLVWVDRMNGPMLRVSFQKMVSGLGSKGAKVQTVMERNLNSGGAWRNQSQWRYRRVGGSEDFGLGSATTLGNASSAQLLHFAPMAPVAPPYPDGSPSR